MLMIGILFGLIAFLLSGLPIFSGLSLFGSGLMLIHEGSTELMAQVIFGEIKRYLLVTIPLFAFMAHVMIKGKIIDDLFGTAYVLTRHLPGGLGIATIVACMIFAAVSGSSVATALTIGSVAIPQMIKFGYDPKTAYGAVAAGGTLGILIPPSGPMVLYGVVSETSIGGLFVAGLIPGIVLASIFIAWCVVSNWLRPGTTKRESRASFKEIILGLKKSFWAVMLPVMVLGGIYSGVFTATEAAAMGASIATLVSYFIYRTVGVKDIWESAILGCRTSAVLFMIVGGASVFAHAITMMRVPQEIVELVVQFDIGMYGFLLILMVLIFFLGMFLESIAIILVTTPVILPVMAEMGINPIWYGVLLMVNLELAMITPPVGMNLFTVKAISRAPMSEIISGALPYVLLMLLGLILLLFIPQLALWLPSTMLELK